MTYHEEVLPFTIEFYRETREEPVGSGNIVRLSDDARGTVVYLGIGDPINADVFEAVGTGFMVCVGKHNYIVTADHVAKCLGDGGFCVRMNSVNNGPAQNHLLQKVKWIRHPTDRYTVDLAVIEFSIPSWASVNLFPARGLISEFKFGSKKIGPGDLAYVVGIFDIVKGKRVIIPAVHTGHVCLIPDDERIPVENWNLPRTTPPTTVDIEAYLIEAPNTLPGGSGGPVFVRRSIQTRLFDKNVDPNPKGIDEWVYGSLWLLGIWTDAWFGNPSEIIRLPAGKNIKVPLGIGVAVPAIKLIEILNGPELSARRKSLASAIDSTRAPDKTSATASSKSALKDGDDILRAALNTAPTPRVKPKAKAAKCARSEVSSK
jgi:hypothetical protein